MSVVGGKQVRLLIGFIEAETTHAFWVDAESVGLSIALRPPTHFQTADPPGLDRNKVVDYEGDTTVVGHVAKLPTGRQALAAAVDCLGAGIVLESTRTHWQRSLRLSGGPSAKRLAGELFAFARGEWHGGPFLRWVALRREVAQ